MNDRDFKADIFTKTAAQWSAEDPHLARNDLGIETDTGRIKVGGGAKWSQTDYLPDYKSPPTVVSLGTVNGTIVIDASAGDIFDLTLDQNAYLDTPTNPVNGKTIRLRISQDATGGRELNVNSTAFVVPASSSLSLQPIALSTGGEKTDIFAATYHAGRGKWDIVSFVQGY